MLVTVSDFAFLQDLVRQGSGIVIDPGKEYLAHTRLMPILDSEGLSTLSELVGRLRRRPWGVLHARVVEAMATTETSFFRDFGPFTALRTEILPALIAARADERRLRICSAACSSGQEPYSIGMILAEDFPHILADWHVQIVALDLCESMIRRCREGRYSLLEVNRGLPARYLTRYFRRVGIQWEVRPELRRRVDFRQHNLVTDSLAGNFDVVFLRNVLMYFAPETKASVLSHVRRALRDDATLFIGSTETILAGPDFRRETMGNISCYRPRKTGGS